MECQWHKVWNLIKTSIFTKFCKPIVEQDTYRDFVHKGYNYTHYIKLGNVMALPLLMEKYDTFIDCDEDEDWEVRSNELHAYCQSVSIFFPHNNGNITKLVVDDVLIHMNCKNGCLFPAKPFTDQDKINVTTRMVELIFRFSSIPIVKVNQAYELQIVCKLKWNVESGEYDVKVHDIMFD